MNFFICIRQMAANPCRRIHFCLMPAITQDFDEVLWGEAHFG